MRLDSCPDVPPAVPGITQERKGREKIKKGGLVGGELDQVSFYTNCGEMGWMTGVITRAYRFRNEHLADCGILLST